MKKIFSILLICFLFLLTPTLVGAEENSGAINEIKENFTELGIDKKTQEKLINKLKNGEIIDSMKEENVEKLFEKVNILNPGKTARIVYPDGSIGEAENLELIPEFNAFSSSTVRQVRSYWNSGMVNVSFTSDFATPSGSYDHIISSHSENATIIGGTLKNEDLDVVRSTENASRRAYSRYKITYDALGGWVGSTFDLFFHVGNNTYETSTSLKDIK